MLAAVSLGMFYVSLSLSSIIVALPYIALDLQASAVQVGWLPTAFLLSNVVFLLPFGRIADRYGRKRINETGLIIFTLASLAAAAAPNVELLIAMRVLQGLGGSMIFATGMALVVAVFDPARRGVALGLTSAAVYLGITCGPFIGGFLTEHVHWRSVFLFQVPLALLSLALIHRLEADRPDIDISEPLDLLGTLLFTGWTLLLFVGVSRLPNPQSVPAIVAGVLLLVIFVRQQLRADYPLVRLKLIWANRVFSRSVLSSFLIYGANYPIVILLSLFLQYILQMTPDMAGRLLMIQAGVMVIVSPLAGKISDHTEPRVVATLGCLAMATGFGLLYGIGYGTNLLRIGAAVALVGLGIGLFSTPNNNAAMGSVPANRLGIASAIMNLARNMGNMLGTAVFLLLISLLIGDQLIAPENYDSLIRITAWVAAQSLVFCLLAAWLSHSRGNIRQ